MNHIDIQHITFHYEKRALFHNLSLQIDDGEFCALMGPNGSGKTTLLKCISGLLPLVDGQICINGHALKDYTARDLAKTVAYVPQHQDIIFDISVYDLVMMGRNPYQNRWQIFNNEDDIIVMEMLEKCHLRELKDRMLSELSGGELQRSLVARAMAQQTPIMLLDEPLSNLDVAHKFEIMDILRKLNREENVLILLIVHDFPMALEYATQAILLNDGQLVQHDVISAVLSPENIRKCFGLGTEFEISASGNISKRQF